MERLLERTEVLEFLGGVVEAAAGGTGALTLVSGEAGIGKTSLLRALRVRVGEEVPFYVGACEPLSVPVPLGPLRELFELTGGGDLTRLGEDRLSLARGLLDALAEQAPCVAAIEDLHWADPTTLDVLRLLARRLEATRVALVATYRDDEVAANRELGLLLGDLSTSGLTRRVRLEPLSLAAVRELAGPVGVDVAEVARVTGGNPFLVVETVAAGGRLPASVRDAALARAGRLTISARRVVDAAAILGQRFSPSLLEAVAPDAAGAVEEALARGVLVADGPALGFRHELMREAIEDSIAPPRREELHRRAVAALLDQPGGVEDARLAHHAELGGLAEAACRFAARAAEQAERVGALREVLLQAGRALRLGRELAPADRFELLVRYSRASNFASASLHEAEAAARDAVAVATELADPVREGRALVALAWALWSLDRVAEARAAAERAVAAFEPTTDEAGLARAYSTRIRMEATAFDPSFAIELGPRALELAAHAGLEDVQLDVEVSVGLARGHRGDGEATAALQAALRDARAAGLTIQTVRTCVNLMCVGATLRDHELVDRTAAEALPLLEEYDTPIPARAIECFLARSLLDRGRWDDAVAAAARGRVIWHGEVPLAEAVEGLVRARRGDPGGGELLARSWQGLAGVPESARHGVIRLALLEKAWLDGDRPAALQRLEDALAADATARYMRCASELAVWASRLGSPLEAPAAAPEPVLLELAGDWRGAVRAWRELEAPYEAALAALPGDDRAARDALATLQRLGATASARAFARERAASGARAPRGPRPSTLANAGGLTRREQEILAELATGATNAAIAERLHLSARTVGHHVSAILRKLGAANRLTAIEKARRGGLVRQDGPLREPS